MPILPEAPFNLLLRCVRMSVPILCIDLCGVIYCGLVSCSYTVYWPGCDCQALSSFILYIMFKSNLLCNISNTFEVTKLINVYVHRFSLNYKEQIWVLRDDSSEPLMQQKSNV